MKSKLKTRIGILLLLSVLSLFMFNRTPGAEQVRLVQALLLFVEGACAGLALGLYRGSKIS